MALPLKNMPVRRPREEEEEVSPLEKHERRHMQRGFDEPSRYGAASGWPPNIEAYVLPRLEMRFETFKEAKDFYNVYAKHAGKAKNSRMDDVNDVLKTVNFFREMKAINREFFCDMQLDESDRVKNIFWANASCRGAYQDFGDCVRFDTTYKTNKYHMPLGVFVGTNNHLQTTFFGYALIRDEDADSFRWLFKTFLRCMRGKAPTCILTDQCPAMALAIPDAFKNTVHKLCRRHIMKKYREHLAYLYNLHKDFKDEFTSILNWPLMPTEFEAAWKGLTDSQVNSCVKTRRQTKNQEILANRKEQNTLTFYGFDTQMAKLYSRAVHSKIRKRLKLSTLFMATETEEPTKYLVRYNNPQKLCAWSQHAFQVVADPVGEIYECECKLWDHTGISACMSYA
ncbi:protein FAR1-RELATED SEQUENCE 3-like [Aegilops tauschii subsp. strangulata]|uniref:protein FAR1-RELATED SEQUENCE 3-like n=1 Tax=Aegilops tauschii subsp. strangulata TaxID=200361 RepID=UPI000989B8CD|nr:protein FAR1-RELATED SEQUENCE 3-like [Aegilops tauschii subsp. strangulata]